MLDLRVHFLEAEGPLERWREQIVAEIADTGQAVGNLVAAEHATLPIDLVVQRLPGAAIPELGLNGSCYRRGLITITLDPDNDNFARSFAAGELKRALTHELHHSFRHAACGYGHTLGEALVSEGLAEAFDAEVNGFDGHFWSHALAAAEWSDILKRAELELWSEHYDHRAWFFGSSNVAKPIPRWTGYTIGYHLVKTYLAENPSERPSRMVGTPASDVVGNSWSRFKTEMGAPV